MANAILTISSKNYGAWALRGWLMARLAGLEFTEHVIPPDDPQMKAEMLLLSASIRVPALEHEGVRVWDTLAIGEYLNEIRPEAGLLPADRAARAHCRAICGEMHSGFSPKFHCLLSEFSFASQALGVSLGFRFLTTAGSAGGVRARAVAWR